MVQVKVCKLCHGNRIFPEVGHGVVAKVEPCDLT